MAKEKEAAAITIAGYIRKSSEAGQLISEPEILHRLAEQCILTPSGTDSAQEVGDLLREAVEENEDLHELSARDGSRADRDRPAGTTRTSPCRKRC